MRFKLLLVVTPLLLVLTACQAEQAADSHEQSMTTTGGDIREKTPSLDALPTFLDDKPEDTKLVYKAVAKSGDLLEHMPCYCGCGESVGHKNNLDCFINRVDADGVVWDDHGTKCGICMEIAVQSIQMDRDGERVKDIRRAIDQAYEERYPAPTPTPMP